MNRPVDLGIFKLFAWAVVAILFVRHGHPWWGDVAWLFGGYELAWIVYQRFGTTQPRTMSPREGGLPYNVIPPRSRWDLCIFRTQPGLHCHVTRVTRAQAVARTNSAYVVGWPAIECRVVALTWDVVLVRWSERWAA